MTGDRVGVKPAALDEPRYASALSQRVGARCRSRLRRGCGGLDRRLHLRARGTRPPAFEAVEGSSGRAMAIGASQPRVSPGCMIVTA